MKPHIYDLDDVRASEHTIADLAAFDFRCADDPHDGHVSEEFAFGMLHSWCASAEVDMMIEIVGGVSEAVRQYREAWYQCFAEDHQPRED